MDEWKHITIFTQALSAEKQAEGIAVHRAVALGMCNVCPFLPRCSTDDAFIPPVFAWCFREQRKILSEWETPQKKEAHK